MSVKWVSRLAAIASVGLAVTACQDEMQSTLGAGGAKANRPLGPELLSLMEQKGMRKEDPILVRAFKQENTLEIWKRDNTGHYAFLKSYPMCAWGGTLGPKIKEGDKQSPEGFYTVTPWRMNPNSQFHLAYDVGYPNAFDKAWGRTGAAIMVHGNCTASAGCFIVTDEQVEEIYGLAREAFSAGQKSFQVQAFPFRMTAENLARHRKNPNMAFWKNIKQGYDHFEVTKLEPKVEVCDRHYVFDAKPKDQLSTTFNPSGACPAYEVPTEIASAVEAKQAKDDQDFRVVVAQLEDADRKEADRLIAEKLEKSKPQPGTRIAAWFGAPVEVPNAEAVPIDVPLPKASPAPFAGVAVASAETSRVSALQAPAEASPATSIAARFFGFGSGVTGSTPAPSSAEPAAAASALPQPQPIAVPVPTARPQVGGTTTVASVAPVAEAAPVAAVEPQPAAPAERPFWKRINPF
jgi:murein L,D-transpeptidase YafK